MQGKEKELQDVRDQLQQAQEERDGHVKTISSLKQVCGISVVPDIAMAETCIIRQGGCALQAAVPSPARCAFSKHRR